MFRIITSAADTDHVASTGNYHRPSFSGSTDISAKKLARLSHIPSTQELVLIFFHASVWVRAYDTKEEPVKLSGYSSTRKIHLISRIRSVEIFVYLHPRSYSRGGLTRLLELIGIDGSPVKTALAMLKNAPIEEMTLTGNTMYCDFRNHRISTLLLEMCSNPNFKSLCLEYISNLPYRFILGNGQNRSLTRLAIRDATISDYCQFVLSRCICTHPFSHDSQV